MKLITWNVQWFCGLDGRIDVDRVLRTARAMADFDVLCLQEVAQNQPQLAGDASHDQVALLREALPGFEVCFGAAVDELAPDGHSRQRFGNVVASRLPVRLLQRHALPWPADPEVSSMPRIAVCATLQAPWGPLRVTTTHLEYYSALQRMAQTQALQHLNREAAERPQRPPRPDPDGGPFQPKPHTADALLCGDFNFGPDSPEYRLLLSGAPALHDGWTLVQGAQPHAPTFRLFDRHYGPEPMTCDFVFVSDRLAPRVQCMAVDVQTRASDHQPVLIELED